MKQPKKKKVLSKKVIKTTKPYKKKKVLSKKVIKTTKPYKVKKVAAVKKSKPITAEKKGVPAKPKSKTANAQLSKTTKTSRAKAELKRKGRIMNAKANSVGGKTKRGKGVTKIGTGTKIMDPATGRDGTVGQGNAERKYERKYYRTGKANSVGGKNQLHRNEKQNGCWRKGKS